MRERACVCVRGIERERKEMRVRGNMIEWHIMCWSERDSMMEIEIKKGHGRKVCGSGKGERERERERGGVTGPERTESL